MPKQTQDNMQNWLKNNWWNLLLTIVGIVIAFTVLQGKVASIEAQVNVLEKKVATYPSQEYFDLRFKTIEQGQQDLKQQITEVKSDLKQHLNDK
jgi:chaperonin cofactor prefoldin